MNNHRRRAIVVAIVCVALSISVNSAPTAPAAAHDLGAGTVDPAGLTYHNCHEVVPFIDVDYNAADELVPEGYTVLETSKGKATLFLNTISCESITVPGQPDRVTVEDVVESHLSIFIVPPYRDDPGNPCAERTCPAEPPHPSFFTPDPHVESTVDSQQRLESYLVQWVTNSEEYADWMTYGTGLEDKVRVVSDMHFDYDPQPAHAYPYLPAVDHTFFAKVPPPALSPFHIGCEGERRDCSAVVEPVPVIWEEGINWWADTEEGQVIIHSEFHTGANQRFGIANGTVTSDDESSPLGMMFDAGHRESSQTKPFLSVSGEFTDIQLTKCVRNASNPCSGEYHPAPEEICSAHPCDAEEQPPPETRVCPPTQRRHLLAAEQRAVLDLVGDLTTLRDHADLAALAAVGYKDYDHYFVSFAGQGLAILDFTRFADVRAGNPSFLLYEPSRDAVDVTDIDGPDFPYSLAGWGYAGPNYSYDKENQRPVYPRELTELCIGAGDWFVHERGIHPADTGGMHSVPPEEDQHGHEAGDTPPIPTDCEPICPVGLPHPRIWDIHLWLQTDGVPSISILNPRRCIPGIPSDVGVAWFYPEDDQREVGREHCATH